MSRPETVLLIFESKATFPAIRCRNDSPEGLKCCIAEYLPPLPLMLVNAGGMNFQTPDGQKKFLAPVPMPGI